MFGNKVPDKDLLKSINKRLVRIGAPTKVMAEVSQGVITLTGQLKYDAQRKQIVKAVGATSGVQQVIDQIQAAPKQKPEHM